MSRVRVGRGRSIRSAVGGVEGGVVMLDKIKGIKSALSYQHSENSKTKLFSRLR